MSKRSSERDGRGQCTGSRSGRGIKKEVDLIRGSETRCNLLDAVQDARDIRLQEHSSPLDRRLEMFVGAISLDAIELGVRLELLVEDRRESLCHLDALDGRRWLRELSKVQDVNDQAATIEEVLQLDLSLGTLWDIRSGRKYCIRAF